ncbi:hypothetical protein GGR40_003505 [Novosphingobium gossypii]
MPRRVLLALMLLSPLPTAAQDIAPVITPGQTADGIFARSVAEGQAKRIREKQSGNKAVRPGTREFQRRACANRPIFRRQYGADHPKVQQLERLCTQSGF